MAIPQRNLSPLCIFYCFFKIVLRFCSKTKAIVLFSSECYAIPTVFWESVALAVPFFLYRFDGTHAPHWLGLFYGITLLFWNATFIL